MQFKEAVNTCFKKYATFSGRASRSEYWYWVLFTFICAFGLAILSVAIFGQQNPNRDLLNNIFTVVTIIPGLAVTSRRLHDVNRSGWWMLISLTGIGILLLLYWYAQKSDDGPNDFGEQPLT
jgi:uncharacterized membrane protein YhaH (DUF805 family)